MSLAVGYCHVSQGSEVKCNSFSYSVSYLPQVGIAYYTRWWCWCRPIQVWWSHNVSSRVSTGSVSGPHQLSPSALISDRKCRDVDHIESKGPIRCFFLFRVVKGSTTLKVGFCFIFCSFVLQNIFSMAVFILAQEWCLFREGLISEDKTIGSMRGASQRKNRLNVSLMPCLVKLCNITIPWVIQISQSVKGPPVIDTIYTWRGPDVRPLSTMEPKIITPPYQEVITLCNEGVSTVLVGQFRRKCTHPYLVL